jgi:uncharacterized protein YuzE
MAVMSKNSLQSYLKFLPTVQSAPQQSVWLTYDHEADVMYINFKKPSTATDSELTDNDIIVRYEGNEILGFTVLHASRRL